MKILKSKFTSASKNKIFSLCGNLIDCESIFSLKLFLDKFGSSNYDCRQDNSFFIPNKRSSYIFNSSIAGIDESDLCVIIGSDIRKEAPILGARLRKKSMDKNMDYNVIRIGYQYDLSIEALELGKSFSSLTNLLNSKHSRLLNKSKKFFFFQSLRPFLITLLI